MPDLDMLAFLPSTPFFAGLDRAVLERVAARLVSRSLPAGATVFEEGDTGASLFVVKSGQLLVFHRGQEGAPPVKLTRLGPGDFFGEMTLIEMQPRSATVRTETDSELLELHSRDLYDLYRLDLKAYAMVLQNVNRELCRRLRRTNERLVEWASSAQDETTQVGMRSIR